MPIVRIRKGDKVGNNLCKLQSWQKSRSFDDKFGVKISPRRIDPNQVLTVFLSMLVYINIYFVQRSHGREINSNNDNWKLSWYGA